MLTLPKCYSALVASGNGKKCDLLKQKISNIGFQKDLTTGYYKSILFKYHKNKYPEIVEEISKEFKKAIESVVNNVDDIYFGNDLIKEKVVEK